MNNLLFVVCCIMDLISIIFLNQKSIQVHDAQQQGKGFYHPSPSLFRQSRTSWFTSHLLTDIHCLQCLALEEEQNFNFHICRWECWTLSSKCQKTLLLKKLMKYHKAQGLTTGKLDPKRHYWDDKCATWCVKWHKFHFENGFLSPLNHGKKKGRFYMMRRKSSGQRSSAYLKHVSDMNWIFN